MLVNNAGVSQRALFEKTLSGISLERKLMEVNYFSVVALTKAFVANINQLLGAIASFREENVIPHFLYL